MIIGSIPDYNLYKIVFYPGTINEYYTFCTREAATTGIENYLNYRKRLGEELSFNQDTIDGSLKMHLQTCARSL
ncbi:MAG TPA: hypothetical protein VFR94_23740 [Nitrososphaeraceae archaeon]|nr:hypothetical protein [Nitrososphaeraceae archaeon]